MCVCVCIVRVSKSVCVCIVRVSKSVCEVSRRV